MDNLLSIRIRPCTRFVAVLVACTLMACTPSSETASVAPGPLEGAPVPVIVQAPLRQPMERMLSLPATVHALERVVVRSRVTGYLGHYSHVSSTTECSLENRKGSDSLAGKCRLDIGDEVVSGEILALVETPVVAAKLGEVAVSRKVIRAEVGVAKAEHRLKSLTHSRLKKLAQRDDRLVAKHKVDKARMEAQLARSRVAAQQARLFELTAKEERLMAQLKFCEIRAPFDGFVSKRFAEGGELVGPNSASSGGPGAILELIRKDSFRVRIPVPESHAANVNPGTTQVTLNISQANIHDRRLPIHRIRRDVDVRSRTLTAEVLLTDAIAGTMPGMLGRAELVIDRHEDALVVPATALVGKKGKVHLFVADGGRAVKRNVQIGIDDGRMVEIIDGIKANESVIISARTSLSDGVLITETTGNKAKE